MLVALTTHRSTSCKFSIGILYLFLVNYTLIVEDKSVLPISQSIFIKVKLFLLHVNSKNSNLLYPMAEPLGPAVTIFQVILSWAFLTTSSNQVYFGILSVHIV